MNTPKDIYEWIELYLLGQLDKAELEKVEEKLRINKAFAEDLCAIEIEMYEEGRLPIERQKQFESRLQHDNKLAQELALHKVTFEVVKYFDNQGCCKDQNIISNQFPPNSKYRQLKHSFLFYLQSKQQRLSKIYHQYFTTRK